MYVKFKNPVQTNTNKKNKDLAIPLCGLLENINIEVFLNDRSQQGLWLINNPSQQGLWLIGHPANRTGFSRSATSERESSCNMPCVDWLHYNDIFISRHNWKEEKFAVIMLARSSRLPDHPNIRQYTLQLRENNYTMNSDLCSAFSTFISTRPLPPPPFLIPNKPMVFVRVKHRERRKCVKVKVGVAVLGSPSLIVVNGFCGRTVTLKDVRNDEQSLSQLI